MLVDSELTEGTVVATTDHLTPYAVARPTSSGARPTVTTTVPPRPSPSAALPSATRPGAGGTPAPAITPGANTTVVTATVSADAARQSLTTAISTYKGKQVKVTTAGGYTGSTAVAFPPALASSLAGLAATGQLAYGIYNGVNEALTTAAGSANASGTLVVLAEPKTSMPASSADASTELAKLFPGAVGPLYVSLNTGTTTGYAFTATRGGLVYVMGIVSYDGPPIAYLVVAGVDYTAVASAAKAP